MTLAAEPARPLEEPQHHVHLRRGDVGRYVLLPGDPGRCALIASRFEDARLVAKNREYETWTGSLDGEPVSVTSTGIGCPSSAIAVEELARIGADTFIRVGTSGGMQPGMRSGELAIVSGAIRDEGTSSHYLPIEFPAVADLEVVLALREAARRTGALARVGISQSKDSFYAELEPDRQPIAPQLREQWDAYVAGGAICSEMEAAAIFVVASILRVRAGGLMICFGAPDLSEEQLEADAARFNLDPLLDTAVEALRVLIAGDRVAAAGEGRRPAGAAGAR
ncbi:MAG TPA: nucleoside phosphorylase [Candidatus Limnocylindrales bacterium]|nr:nucleoside phosphorylase [Candidatus Limnocylindrales bacterium]